MMQGVIALISAGDNLRLSDFDAESCLIYGLGNVGRQDDGLGWAFIDWLETSLICTRAEKVKFYQLNLEDADLISRKDRVLFVDASKDTALESFRLYQVEPKIDFSFTSHALSIETVVATCDRCFGKMPEVFVLAIRGYEWELDIGLTDRAKVNLQKAIHHTSRSVRSSAAIASN